MLPPCRCLRRHALKARQAATSEQLEAAGAEVAEARSALEQAAAEVDSLQAGVQVGACRAAGLPGCWVLGPQHPPGRRARLSSRPTKPATRAANSRRPLAQALQAQLAEGEAAARKGAKRGERAARELEEARGEALARAAEALELQAQLREQGLRHEVEASGWGNQVGGSGAAPAALQWGALRCSGEGLLWAATSAPS
jgi:hypothetical protein